MMLRRYSPADADRVNEIALAAFEQYRAVYDDWEALQRGAGSMAGLSETADLIVAEAAGRIVGAVAYVPPFAEPRADFFRPEWPIIRMLVVDPAARGRSVGRRLAQACIDRARSDGAETIALHTSPAMAVALALYLRMGFTMERKVADRFGVPYAVYCKPLQAVDCTRS